MATPTNGNTAETGTVHDQRDKPRGVLPRQLQMWLMVGIAVVVLLIILVTGHSQPAPPSAGPRPVSPTPPASDRIRAYQQQLSDDEAHLRQLQAQAATVTKTGGAGSGTAPSGQSDPIADEQRRRDYQSLFADNVALSRRAEGDRPSAATHPPAASQAAAPVPDTTAILQALAQVSSANASRPPVGAAPAAAVGAPQTLRPTNPPAVKAHEENAAAGPRLPLLEGTVIETVLTNRLDGTFTGPVNCLVTTPAYSEDRQSILIPAGARLLGAAAPVQAWGDSRLAVSFHRLVMPDGHTYSLDQFKGLDQIGETGLKDEVSRHYLQVFGAAIAIGALSGLAQYNTRGFDANTFGDVYRQAAGASLASSGTRILDRYLNVLPTITIREGFRIKVYLTNDLMLPTYAPTNGGGDQ